MKNQKMTKLFYIIILLLASVFVPVSNAIAQEDIFEEPRPSSGFYAGLGAIGGYEFKEIKRFEYGAATKIGYMIDENMSVVLASDLLFASKWGVNFMQANIVPTFQYYLYESAYSYIGVGYELLHSSQAVTFAGPDFTLSANAKKNYSGFVVSAGIGYDFWLKHFTITPEVGFNYSRIASSNMYTPVIRVVGCYHF